MPAHPPADAQRRRRHASTVRCPRAPGNGGSHTLTVGVPAAASPPSRRCDYCAVDPHHPPALGRCADLGEPGLLEDLHRADVDLAPGDLQPGLGDHGVALDGGRSPLPGVVGGGLREGVGDAPAAVALADAEAGHRPHALVVLVLVAPRPRHPQRAQLRVGDAGFDGDPTDRLVPRGRRPGRSCAPPPAAAGGARPVHGQAFLEGGVPPQPAGDLQALALAVVRVVGRAEDRHQVLPGGLVGGDDPQLVGRDGFRHASILVAAARPRPARRRLATTVEASVTFNVA